MSKFSDWSFDNRFKIAATIVAILNLVGVLFLEFREKNNIEMLYSVERITTTLTFFGMICIWFAEAMSEYSGVWKWHYIERKSSSGGFTFVGWLLLISSAIYLLFIIF